MWSKKFKILIICLICFAFILSLLNLQTGYMKLGWESFFYKNAESIIANLRVNRVLVMILAGLSIPTSGFLLQEYFQNPLAGPSVLGITSASSLTVAVYLFISHDWMISELLQNGILSIIAMIGSLLIMLLLVHFSYQNHNATFLIIVGFLISALAGAIVSILQLYADNQSLKNYILWSFGANANVSRNQVYILSIIVTIGLFVSFKTIKPLIGSALGEDYAKSLGVDLRFLKVFIIIASSILSASVTAFLGPILFIGIIVPHFCRTLYNPAKLWQQWMLNMLFGVIIMQAFSIASELTQLPINVMTSLFGIPVIFMMMLRKKTTQSWS